LTEIGPLSRFLGWYSWFDLLIGFPGLAFLCNFERQPEYGNNPSLLLQKGIVNRCGGTPIRKKRSGKSTIPRAAQVKAHNGMPKRQKSM